MTCWNFAEAIYRLAEGETGRRAALVHDGQSISYIELRRRAQGIASYLLQSGLEQGAHVGHYLRNTNAYLETFVGSALAGFSHVNVNYRYQDDELVDLCNGLDLAVLVYEAEFADRVARVRPRLQKTRVFICVGDSGDDVSLASLYGHDSSRFRRRTSGDHLVLIATGGTTGLPKGVQWRHEAIWQKQNVSVGLAMAPLGLTEPPADMSEHVANVARLPQMPPFLCLSPLMHGAGFLMAIMLLAQGVPIATLPGRRFDPERALRAIADLGVGSMVLVGDAFAVPLLDVLDRHPGENLLGSLSMLVSSGAALSNRSRARFERHRPGLAIVDSLGASETSGYAVCTPEAGVFQPHPTTRVLDDGLADVVPGSGVIGIVYAGGHLPEGYYNAPAATAETFLELDGQRYVRTGDRCTVRPDGMLELLGRDSTVINTGGEKVYTVEVERALIEHPDVTDAVVVGLPHPRFGSQVVAVVECSPRARVGAQELRGFVSGTLADYKVPRQVFFIESLCRAPNGKPDYPFVIEHARACAAAEEEGRAPVEPSTRSEP